MPLVFEFSILYNESTKKRAVDSEEVVEWVESIFIGGFAVNLTKN